MAITHSKKLVDGPMAQLDSMIQTSMQQALRGKAITPEVQQYLDSMRTKMVAPMDDEMDWNVLEPGFLDIYRQSLYQTEVDGMLAFYKSDTGQAVIAKMPVIMQRNMHAMRQRMMVVMPKTEQIQNETLSELNARRTPAAGPSGNGASIQR